MFILHAANIGGRMTLCGVVGMLANRDKHTTCPRCQELLALASGKVKADPEIATRLLLGPAEPVAPKPEIPRVIEY